MTEAEKLVRESWEHIIHNGSIGVGLIDAGQTFSTWEYALAFTRDRQEQVRLLDEEIDHISFRVSLLSPREHEHIALTRTIKRLQETRKELTRGMTAKEAMKGAE